MTVDVIDEAEVMREAAEILLKHMSPAKVVRFWASWHMGQGDFLKWRDDTFTNETVTTLFEKITSFEQENDDSLTHEDVD